MGAQESHAPHRGLQVNGSDKRNGSPVMNDTSKKREPALIVVVIILFIASVSSAPAQTRQQPKIQPPPQSGGEPNGSPSILVSPDEDYRIGPRDVIEIRVD